MSDDLKETAVLSELTSEELIRRGEALLRLGQRLLGQANDLNGVAAGLVPAAPSDDEPYAISGRGDKIRLGDAIEISKTLGTFTRKEFEEAAHLKPHQATKFLALLINNKPPILEYTLQGTQGRASLYTYIEIKASAPRRRPRHAPAVDAASQVGVDRVENEVVSYTGRPKGSSGKPGRDKRISQTRRVRRGKNNIIGGR